MMILNLRTNADPSGRNGHRTTSKRYTTKRKGVNWIRQGRGGYVIVRRRRECM